MAVVGAARVIHETSENHAFSVFISSDSDGNIFENKGKQRNLSKGPLEKVKKRSPLEAHDSHPSSKVLGRRRTLISEQHEAKPKEPEPKNLILKAEVCVPEDPKSEPECQDSCGEPQNPNEPQSPSHLSTLQQLQRRNSLEMLLRPDSLSESQLNILLATAGDRQIICALSGIFVMIVQKEILWINGPSLVTDCLKSVVTFFTVLLILAVVSFYQVRLAILRRKYLVPKSANVLTTSLAPYMLLEMLVCAMHPPPMVDRHENQNLENYLCALMFLRVYLIVRYLSLHSPLFTPSGRFIGVLTQVEVTPSFVMKTVLAHRPWVSLACLLVLVLAINSFCMYQFERYSASVTSDEADDDLMYYRNVLWCLIITSLTVGYGDVYPHTDPGRFFSVVTALLGACITAIMVSLVHTQLELTLQQTKVVNFLRKDEVRNKIKLAATRAVQSWWRFHRARKRAAKSPRRYILASYAEMRMYRRITQWRYAKRTYLHSGGQDAYRHQVTIIEGIWTGLQSLIERLEESGILEDFESLFQNQDQQDAAQEDRPSDQDAADDASRARPSVGLVAAPEGNEQAADTRRSSNDRTEGWGTESRRESEKEGDGLARTKQLAWANTVRDTAGDAANGAPEDGEEEREAEAAVTPPKRSASPTIPPAASRRPSSGANLAAATARSDVNRRTSSMGNTGREASGLGFMPSKDRSVRSICTKLEGGFIGLYDRVDRIAADIEAIRLALMGGALPAAFANGAALGNATALSTSGDRSTFDRLSPTGGAALTSQSLRLSPRPPSPRQKSPSSRRGSLSANTQLDAGASRGTLEPQPQTPVLGRPPEATAKTVLVTLPGLLRLRLQGENESGDEQRKGGDVGPLPPDHPLLFTVSRRPSAAASRSHDPASESASGDEHASEHVFMDRNETAGPGGTAQRLGGQRGARVATLPALDMDLSVTSLRDFASVDSSIKVASQQSLPLSPHYVLPDAHMQLAEDMPNRDPGGEFSHPSRKGRVKEVKEVKEEEKDKPCGGGPESNRHALQQQQLQTADRPATDALPVATQHTPVQPLSPISPSPSPNSPGRPDPTLLPQTAAPPSSAASQAAVAHTSRATSATSASPKLAVSVAPAAVTAPSTSSVRSVRGAPGILRPGRVHPLASDPAPGPAMAPDPAAGAAGT